MESPFPRLEVRHFVDIHPDGAICLPSSVRVTVDTLEIGRLWCSRLLGVYFLPEA